MHPVLDRLRRGGKVLLDGAMGTELERRGVATPLPLWSAAALESHPEAVRAIHTEYAASGAEVLKTCTFRTTPRTFAKAGRSPREAETATRRTVGLARQAAANAGKPVAVAGTLAPLEDC